MSNMDDLINNVNAKLDEREKKDTSQTNKLKNQIFRYGKNINLSKRIYDVIGYTIDLQ